MFNTNCYGNESIPAYTQGVESPWSAHTTHNGQGIFHQHPVTGNANAFVGYGLGQIQSKELDLAGVVGMKETSGTSSTSAATNAWHHSHRMRYSSAAATATRGFLPYQMSPLPHYDSQSVDTSHLTHSTHHQPFWVTNPNAYSLMGTSYQRDHNSYAERADTSRNSAAIRHNTAVPNRNYVEDQSRNVNATLQQQPAPVLSQHCQRQSRQQLHQLQQHQQLQHQQDYLRNQMTQRERDPCQYTSSSYHQESMRVGVDPTLYHDQHLMPSTQQHHQQYQASQEALRKVSENERRTAFTPREAWPQTWPKPAYVPFDTSQTFLSNHRSTGSAFQPCSKQTDSDPYSMDSIWAKSAVPAPSSHVAHTTNHTIPPSNNHMPLPTQSWLHDSTSHLKPNVYRPPQDVNQATNVPSNFSTNVLNLDTGQVELSMSVVPPEYSLNPLAVSQTQRHRTSTSHPTLPIQQPNRTSLPVQTVPHNHMKPVVKEQPPPKPAEPPKPTSTARAAGLDVRQFLATWNEDHDLATPRPAIVEGDDPEPEPPEQPPTSLVVLDYQNVPSEEAAGLLQMYPGLQLSGNDHVVLLDNTTAAGKTNLDFVLSRAVPTTSSSAPEYPTANNVQSSAINIVQSPATETVPVASSVPEKSSTGNQEASPCDASTMISTNAGEYLVDLSSQPRSQEPSTPASVCESDSDKGRKSSLRLFRKRKAVPAESDASSCSEATDEVQAKATKSDDQYNSLSSWFVNDSMDTIDGPIRTPVSVSSAAYDSAAQSPYNTKDSEAKSVEAPPSTESAIVSVITVNQVKEKTPKSMPDISDDGIFGSATRLEGCDTKQDHREPDNTGQGSSTVENEHCNIMAREPCEKPGEETSVDTNPCGNVEPVSQEPPDKTDEEPFAVEPESEDALQKLCERDEEADSKGNEDISNVADSGTSSPDRETSERIDDEPRNQSEWGKSDKLKEKCYQSSDSKQEEENRDVAYREFCYLLDRELGNFTERETQDLSDTEHCDLTDREHQDLTDPEPCVLTDREHQNLTDPEPCDLTDQEPCDISAEEPRNITDKKSPDTSDREPCDFTDPKTRDISDQKPVDIADPRSPYISDQETCDFAYREPRDIFEREPCDIADQKSPYSPDREPCDFACREPRDTSDREPCDIADQKSPYISDREPCDFAYREPRDIADQKSPYISDREPCDFGYREPRDIADQKSPYISDREPCDFACHEPRNISDREPRDIADQKSPYISDQEPCDFAYREPRDISDEPRDTVDQKPPDISDRETCDVLDQEPRDICDREHSDISDGEPCDFADRSPYDFTDREPLDLTDRESCHHTDQQCNNITDWESTEISHQEPTTNRDSAENMDFDDVINPTQNRRGSFESTGEPPGSIVEEEVQNFGPNPDPEPYMEPTPDETNVKSPEHHKNESEDIPLYVSPKAAPEDSQETTKYLSRIVGSAPGKIPKILLSRLKEVKTRRKNGVVKKLPNLRIRRVRSSTPVSGEELPEYECREKDYQAKDLDVEMSARDLQPEENVIPKTESPFGSSIESDISFSERRNSSESNTTRSKNPSPIPEKILDLDGCPEPSEVSPKASPKRKSSEDTEVQDVSLPNEYAGTPLCPSHRMEDPASITHSLDPSCVDLRMYQEDQSGEEEVDLRPATSVSPFEKRMSSGQFFRNKSPDAADRLNEDFTRRDAVPFLYVNEPRVGSDFPRYFEKDITSGPSPGDLRKAFGNDVFRLKSPPLRTHSFPTTPNHESNWEEDTNDAKFERAENYTEKLSWTDEDTRDAVVETSRQSPKSLKERKMESTWSFEDSACSCEVSKTSESEKEPKEDDSGHSGCDSSSVRSRKSSRNSQELSPLKISKNRDFNLDDEDESSDSSDESSVSSSGTTRRSSSSESSSSENSGSSDEDSSDNEVDDKSNSEDKDDNTEIGSTGPADKEIAHEEEVQETRSADILEKEYLPESTSGDVEKTPLCESTCVSNGIDAQGLDGEPVLEKTENLPETSISNLPVIEPVAKTQVEESNEVTSTDATEDVCVDAELQEEEISNEVSKMDLDSCPVPDPVADTSFPTETDEPRLDRASVPDSKSAHTEKTDSTEFPDHVEPINGTEVLVEEDTLLFTDADTCDILVEGEDGSLQVENGEEFLVVDEEQYNGLCNGTMEVFTSESLKTFTVEYMGEVEMCEGRNEEVHSSLRDQGDFYCDEIRSAPVEEVVDNVSCDIGREEICGVWHEDVEEVDVVPDESTQMWPYSEEVADKEESQLSWKEETPLQVKCSLSWDRILNEGQGLVLGPANVEVLVPGEEPKQHTHWKVVTRERKRAGTSKNRSCVEENNNVMPDLKSPIIVVKRLVLKRPRSRRSHRKREPDTIEDVWEGAPKITPLKTKGALKAFQVQSDFGQRSRHQSWPSATNEVKRKSGLKRRKSELGPSAPNWNGASPQRLPKVIIKKTGEGPQYQSFICESDVIMQPVVSIERNAEIDNLALTMWSEGTSLASSGGRSPEDDSSNQTKDIEIDNSSELNGTVQFRKQKPSKVRRAGQLMKVVELLQQWRQAERDEASKVAQDSLQTECVDTIENNNSLLCVDNNADDDKYLCQFHSPKSSYSSYSRNSREGSVTNDNSYSRNPDVETVEERQENGAADVADEENVGGVVEDTSDVVQDEREVVHDVIAQEDDVSENVILEENIVEEIVEDETDVQEVIVEDALEDSIVEDAVQECIAQDVLQNGLVEEVENGGVTKDIVQEYKNTGLVEACAVQEADSSQDSTIQEADSAMEENIVQETLEDLQEEFIVQGADCVVQEDVYQEEIRKDEEVSCTEKENVEGNVIEESPQQSRRTSIEEELGLQLVCQVCGFTTTRLEEQAHHIRTHSYHCQRCQLAFLSHEDFKEHLAAEHPTIEELHHCLLCQRTFPTAERHAQHKKGWHHCQMERSQRHTIHSLFLRFTGRECPFLPSLAPDEAKAFDWLPSDPGVIHFYHDATPLQLAVQDCQEAKDDAETC